MSEAAVIPQNANASLGTALARHRGHGVPHRRRVRHLHHLHRGLSLLPRQEPHRAHAARRPRSSHLHQHLPALLAAPRSTSPSPRCTTASAACDSLWLAATVLLGGIFLAGTAHEWYQLIISDHLTIQTNLFGTTFYSLVGLHAPTSSSASSCSRWRSFFSLTGSLTSKHTGRLEVLSLYWHFVDAVWVVVFTVVYILGRY